MTSESCFRIQRNTLHHVRLDLGKSVSYPALKLDPTVDSCSWFQLIWMPVERCTLAVDGGAEVNVRGDYYSCHMCPKFGRSNVRENVHSAF